MLSSVCKGGGEGEFSVCLLGSVCFCMCVCVFLCWGGRAGACKRVCVCVFVCICVCAREGRRAGRSGGFGEASITAPSPHLSSHYGSAEQQRCGGVEVQQAGGQAGVGGRRGAALGLHSLS